MMERSRAETRYAILFYLQPAPNLPREKGRREERKREKVTFNRIKQATLSKDSKVLFLSRFWEAETALEVPKPKEI